MGQDQPVINFQNNSSNPPSPPVATIPEYIPPDTPPTSPPPAPDPYNMFGGRRAIATVLGLIVLVTGVATGVLFIDKQQEVKIKAFECTNYTFLIEADGSVKALNGSTSKVNSQTATVYLNGKQVAILSVPEIAPGDSKNIGQISIPSDSLNWKVIGSVDCESTGTFSP